MRVPLDRESGQPLYRQIQSFLGEQIRSGTLPPETRLPASRDLAGRLGVSRMTVTNAYAELEAEGLIVGRLGAGTFVTKLHAPVKSDAWPAPDRDWPLWQQRPLGPDWEAAHRGLSELIAPQVHEDEIAFVGGTGAKRLYPAEDFRKAIQGVLRREGGSALSYGDPSGYRPLRTTIAHILASQGVPAHPENVLITSGAQQALALVAYTLLRQGDVVLVESPTYIGALALFRSLGIRLSGIPVDDQGMDVALVEDRLKAVRPRLIYLNPTFQNPTGTCLSGSRRRALIALADRYDVPIVEDDIAGDLRYDGRAQPALKALDPGGRVIYVSTFSKVLMPGIRVGFLSAEGPIFERLGACKRVQDLATSNLLQRALEAYITVGRYQTHLRRACRLYRRRRDAMLDALERHMPEGVRWQPPQGGLFLWLRLPDGLSANQLLPMAREEAVTFAPGSRFFPSRPCEGYLRLNFSMNPPLVIGEGIQRLARAIGRLSQRAKTGPRADVRQREVGV